MWALLIAMKALWVVTTDGFCGRTTLPPPPTHPPPLQPLPCCGVALVEGSTFDELSSMREARDGPSWVPVSLSGQSAGAIPNETRLRVSRQMCHLLYVYVYIYIYRERECVCVYECVSRIRCTVVMAAELALVIARCTLPCLFYRRGFLVSFSARPLILVGQHGPQPLDGSYQCRTTSSLACVKGRAVLRSRKL